MKRNQQTILTQPVKCIKVSARYAFWLLVVLTTWGANHSTSWAQTEESSFVLESHVGARPRDADSLLAPLLDQLEKNGIGGSSVAGTRIHSRHSITSKQLTNKQIATARRDIKDGHSAFIDARLTGAIASTTKGLRLLLSRPATLARQQQVRELMNEALIILALTNSRLGNTAELNKYMGEYIRTFPKTAVNSNDFGPEAAKLYQRINRKIRSQEKGELQIAANDGYMVFVNEQFVGIGSLKVNLFPGSYRIFTQSGSQVGRVHITKVTAGRTTMLIVDPMIDKVLRTEKRFAGLVFHDQQERKQEENRVTLQIGRAVGAKNIVLVGFKKVDGRDSIAASLFSMEKGEIGRSARVPFPDNGSPSAKTLRNLADFITGNRSASKDIKVFSPNIPIKILTQSPSTVSKVANNNKTQTISTQAIPTKSTGIHPVWRYSSWLLGIAGMATGGYLLKLDGDPSCQSADNQKKCRTVFKLKTPGYASIGGGAVFTALGFYLWTLEGSDKKTQISIIPTETGWSTMVSGKW